MKTPSSSPFIKDALSVRSRYVRAVNIGRDLNDADALSGYLMTDSIRHAMSRLCQGLMVSSSQRAWRITGSYGGGKSAFGLFLVNLFTHPINKRSAVGRLLDEASPELLALAKKLPRYEVIVITGTREDASIALANALLEHVNQRRSSPTQKQLVKRLTAYIVAREKGQKTPAAVLALLTETRSYLASGVNASEGLLLVVDEMGRWLEYAADPDTDIDASFFQALAEECGGRVRDIPVAIVGILHQRFEDYAAGRRDKRSGMEWAKVAERFEDITFAQSFESTTRLVAQAMESDTNAYKRAGIVAQASALYTQAVKLGVLESSLLPGGISETGRLYPFHPMALASAVALFRRFGQNERSTFSFLLASEPFALQDFIGRRRLAADSWYRVHDLCDWMLAQGSLRTLDEDRLKRWALLQEVLRAAPVYAEAEVQCLKTVGLLNLLEPQSGISITAELVAFAVSDQVDSKVVLDAIAKLVQKTLLYVRPATQELCLWPQSSVDVASELARVRKTVPALTHLGNLIDLLPSPRPVVAHRHYLTTGTLRTAHVKLVEELNDVPRLASAPLSSDGEILVVPCYPDQEYKTVAKRLKELSATAPEGRLLVLRRITEEDLELADELSAWNRLERECADLRVDTYARNEVRQSVHRLTSALVHRLADLRSPTQGSRDANWWHVGVALDMVDGRGLNRQLSEIFDHRFAQSPKVRNELINRNVVSTAAAAARQRLLERMFSHAHVENLGIEQTPPEKAIYLSVLKDSGLHTVREGQWTFQQPIRGSDWHLAWTALYDMLEEKGLVSAKEVLMHFAASPFGMRESVALLLIGAFLCVQRHNVILRERGTYITQLEDSHIARLVKRPETFELHMVHAQSTTLAALEVYRDVLSAQVPGDALTATVPELTRRLYEWYLSLPEHTLNTTYLDVTHRAALALLGKSSDPVELLTVGLPLALGVLKQARPIDAGSKINLQLLRGRVESLLRAGSDRLNVLRANILKVMAEEVGVRDPATVRSHVIALADKAQDEVVDYALKAFIQRSGDGQRSEAQWIDSLASLLGGRSLETWHDDTLLRFRAELRRVYTLLTRVVALAKLTGKRSGPDHTVVAVHVVDQKGQERFITVPADAQGLMPAEQMDDLRAALSQSPVPAYALARLLLEYSVELSDPPQEAA
ncbi:hypothetical protein EIJ44_05700 [Xanthomonas perforans]|uniref:hypothetical protein n=4 Tax=Xanthomonas TaxID=338 RepID=UPI00115C8ED0|nr:hypothetical protein [Xanthomonas perforans]TQT04106.1 hypothetical protein EIJ44_05700 [Xanthomonas perforans]